MGEVHGAGLHSLRRWRPSGRPDRAQVVVLGSASEPDVAELFRSMAAQRNGGTDARLLLKYDEGLSHRIYAGELGTGA